MVAAPRPRRASRFRFARSSTTRARIAAGWPRRTAERRQADAQSPDPRRAVSIEGIGLHSGRPVRMRLLPAEPGTGIVFVRTDRGGLRFRPPPVRGPQLLRHGPRAGRRHRQHHRAPDGGALRAAGRRPGGRARRPRGADPRRVVAAVRRGDPARRPRGGVARAAASTSTLIRPIVVSREEKRIAAYPCREYRVTYAIDFDHPCSATRSCRSSLWRRSAFAEKLAPARTFTFERRGRAPAREAVWPRRFAGQRGGARRRRRAQPGAAVSRRVRATQDARSDRRPVAARADPLRAHVVAYRAGHDLHARLARRIWNSRRDCWYLAPWSEASRRPASRRPAGDAVGSSTAGRCCCLRAGRRRLRGSGSVDRASRASRALRPA